MSKAGAAAEPSMEDILASIRKIISDDEPVAVPVPEPESNSQAEIDAAMAAFEMEDAPAEPVAEIDPFDAVSIEEDVVEDVFELTDDMASEDAPVAQMSIPEDESDIIFAEADEEPEPEPEPVAVAPAFVMPQAPAAPQMRYEAPPAPAPKPQQHYDIGQTVSAQFDALSNVILANNSRTLDDIVTEMMRPMLKSWIDQNLPSIVERLVREEIERVSRSPRR